MKLVMTLLCRDEADILDANICFHLNQGIDHIIATNNLSTDDTVSILRGYEREGVLTVIDQREDTFDQDIWVTQMARIAASVHGADWVINSDEDEFWWPRQGNIKELLDRVAPNIEMVFVPRNNFLPNRNESGPFHQRMRIREASSKNALGVPLPPKACHRGYPDINVSFGNHSARRGEDDLIAIDGGAMIEILHFPLRAYAQFEAKIVTGAPALNRNQRLDRGIGSTWRWLWDEYNHGRLREYYESQLLDEDAVTRGLESGTLVYDERLHQFLSAYASFEQHLDSGPRAGEYAALTMAAS